jgi:pyridoxamine 5'-phosphate oxidase
MNPMEQLLEWQREQQDKVKSSMLGLCCLSTIGEDGYPNARYVSLKEINKQGFIMTGPLQSMKGKELLSCSKTALTFWWEETGRQIRVQGEATQLSEEEADEIWTEMIRDIQILSWASDQSAEIDDPEKLEKRYMEIDRQYQDQEIPRPENWGGFTIAPSSIEFLDSPESHLQTRVLYKKVGKNWQKKYLQP